MNSIKTDIAYALAEVKADTRPITGGHACQFCADTDITQTLSEIMDALSLSQQLISLPAITRVLRSVLQERYEKDLTIQAGSTGTSMVRGSTLRAHLVNHAVHNRLFLQLNLVRRGPVL